MSVKIYAVFEHFVPGVKIDGKIVPVVLNNKRRWATYEEVEKALENRGYVRNVDPFDGTWSFSGQKAGAKGRPATETLEEQAMRRAGYTQDKNGELQK